LMPATDLLERWARRVGPKGFLGSVGILCEKSSGAFLWVQVERLAFWR